MNVCVHDVFTPHSSHPVITLPIRDQTTPQKLPMENQGFSMETLHLEQTTPVPKCPCGPVPMCALFGGRLLGREADQQDRDCMLHPLY